ncbi:hypothetical protein BJ138DRAFT_1145081 [Hygrophoropsis aurantiaca]|uniref:Uncharacterized protein n=1 Tax=Hygrophoropsis aurantiaca TaxID=72124 RepID=A0ACB8AK98_9AGAM|nr:hypothetical protein BJ138DRAFT_1145081 [Hygrophoropsis aurantiaca]
MERDEAAVNPTPDIRLQQQRSSIPSFLFITFMLFMLTNHNGDEFLAHSHYQDALQSLNYQLSNFTAWMNGTESNFSLPTKHSAINPLVESFVSFDSQLGPSQSYFSNITGFVRGDLDFYNITPSRLALEHDSWTPYAQSFMSGTNMSELLEKTGNWNWTASEKISWSVLVRSPNHINGSEGISMVHGRIDITDTYASEDMRLDFEGVYFLNNGSIYGFAEPPGRHIDIRYMPALVPDSLQNATAHAIEPELVSRISKLKDMIDAGIIDQDATEEDSAFPACGFGMYAQIEPSMISKELMQELEEELQRPTGKHTLEFPKLSLNGVLLSKECGILYRLHNTEGLRSQTFFRKVTTYAGLSALFYLFLLILLSRQMESCRTPAGMSRVSLWTFLTQAIVDAVSFAGHITFAILAHGRPSLSLVAPAFLACVLFAFEAQFAILINQIQAPEEAAAVLTAPPPRQVETPNPEFPTTVPSPTQDNPPPRPALPASPSLPRLLLQHLQSDPQARIWIGMFFFLTFIVRVIVSPSLALLFVATMYSFFWLPQIVRSARRGRTTVLSLEYLVGTSICRLFFALYFLGCPKNVLDVEPRRWVFYLAIFVMAQVFVVFLQQRFGPTFFLPNRFAAAPTHDYHPLLSTASDPEAADHSLGDCAICMEDIHADDPKLLQVGTGGLLRKVSVRRNYSLAPCSHLFHTECLEKWLAIKNICPQCRRPLPPL